MEPAGIAGIIGAIIGVIGAAIAIALLINRKGLVRLCNIDIAKKFNYAPGDTISGNVALTLKKPVKAKELSISLIGEQLITSRQESSSQGITLAGIGSSKHESTRTERVRIYEFKQPLDSEKEYSQGRQYRFEIKIPADILGKRPQTTGAIPFPVKWYLLANLDKAWAFPITKKVDITIG